MDLTTNYMGLMLAHPLMVGASPLADDLDTARRLEDAGAYCIVMRSLFEEQITAEQLAAHRHFDQHGDTFAEATSMFPSSWVFALAPDAYLEQLQRLRGALRIPVIASLNGTTRGGWLSYAKKMEQAGAHALELNLYSLPSNDRVDADELEIDQQGVVSAVTSAVQIPVAVKLSPFYSSLPNFLLGLENAKAKGAVLFNRLYQPDIDIENLELRRELKLSDSTELPLRLRWLAITSAKSNLSLSVSGGVHSAVDIIKALMAGATTVQMVSALLKRGPGHLTELLYALKRWLEEHQYESLAQLRGSMNLARCPDPSAYERANYAQLLQSWHGKK
jgi:dihydroorotate dehydrogenase (fumarate)